jgi:periplasmic protein TonB
MFIRLLTNETQRSWLSYTSSALLHGTAAGLAFWGGLAPSENDKIVEFAGNQIMIAATWSEASEAGENQPVLQLSETKPSPPQVSQEHELQAATMAMEHGAIENNATLEPTEVPTLAPTEVPVNQGDVALSTEESISFHTAPAPQRTVPGTIASIATYVEPQTLGTVSQEEPVHFSSSPLPRYPQAWKQRGLRGTVVLRLTVNTAGKIERLEIATSSGYSELDNSAVQAVQFWTARPASRNGVAVATTVLLPVVFEP